MRKSTLRLSIHSETLRLLAQKDLALVAGGEHEARLFDSGNAGGGCVNGKQLIRDTGNAGTGCVP
jgi:hypothetical protein